MTKKILLVDDELDLAFVTKVRLEESGYEVIGVPSGEKALEFLKDHTPDLVLLDLLLLGIRGEDVCKILKKDVRLKKIPVLLFTASANDIQKVVRDSGADDYLMKPCEPEDMLAKIQKYIG